MSSPPTSDGSQQSGSGLGRSTPLVTVSNVHSGIRTSTAERMAPAVSAGTDHPLASVELSERPSPAPAAQVAVAAVTPQPKPAAVPTATVVKLPASAAQTPPTKTPTPAKKTPQTLDEMADAFLERSSARTESGLPPLLKPEPLPKHEEGIQRLRTLAHRRAWGDVLQVCGEMLRGAVSPYTAVYASLVNSEEEESIDSESLREETMEILTLECHAWLKLRRYAELGREIDRWNFLSHNDFTATSPDWVPWSIHIMAAESLQYTDPSSARCTDELYSLRKVLEEKKQTAWLPCVDNALANAFLRRGEWRLALAALDSIVEYIPAACQAIGQHHEWTETTALKEDQVVSVVGKLSCAFRCEIRSRQGRIMLQLGALAEASLLFEEAKKEWQSCPSAGDAQQYPILQHMPTQIRINDGLLCFSYAEYDQAMTHFRKAIDLERALYTSDPPRYHKLDWTGPNLVRVDAHNTSLSHCLNNLALCALYTCRMQDAVRMMESLVRESPSSFLTERLAFNLCTLYELGSDAASSTRKKRVLQVIAKRFYLHDIGPESFRVN